MKHEIAPVQLQLVRPDERYRETFLRGLREFQAEGLPWWMGPVVDEALRDFPTFVQEKLAEAHATATAKKTHLWALSRTTFVGRIAIYHALDDALRRAGGHIGYDTVPSMRGRGFATEMLRRALPVAQSLGLSEVLLTCNDDNAASIRVIEKNGGVLTKKESLDPSGPIKRYYRIELLQS